MTIAAASPVHVKIAAVSPDHVTMTAVLLLPDHVTMTAGSAWARDNYSCLTWSHDNGSCLNWPRENYRCFTWQNNQSSCIAWPITVILAATHLTTWQWQLSSASCPTASTSSSGLVRDSRQLGCRLGLRCTPTHEVINECGLKRCRGVWLNGHEYFINILKAVLIL